MLPWLYYALDARGPGREVAVSKAITPESVPAFTPGQARRPALPSPVGGGVAQALRPAFRVYVAVCLHPAVARFANTAGAIQRGFR